jgi:integrase
MPRCRLRIKDSGSGHKIVCVRASPQLDDLRALIPGHMRRRSSAAPPGFRPVVAGGAPSDPDYEVVSMVDAKSQSTRRGILEACFQEPHKDDDPEPIGFCPLVHLAPRHVKRLRDLKKGLPGAANNRRKYLSAMFGWAVEQDPPLLKSNPARDVRRVKYVSSGFHTWTADEVQQFEERHPIGTKPRLALALLMFTGARRQDMVTLGKQHVRDGWLRFVPKKTLYKRNRISEKPWLPCLAEVVAASPCGDLTFLVTEYGKPFSDKGFGNWFRDRCDEAGLPHCTAHGLRKMGATRTAESGATTNQLMAIFDWDTPAQAKIYTDAADRKRMAGEAMPMLARTK